MLEPVTLTSEWIETEQTIEEINLDPDPNNSYKTNENFTGFYTEVNLKVLAVTLATSSL